MIGGHNMSILILYASKYGATKKIAELIADKLGNEVTVRNIKDGTPNINEYDSVIIGGSIYMNKIQKSITSFLNKNEKELMKKKIGLFIGCYTAADTEGYLEQFFSQELLQHAKAKGMLGGIMQYEKMNFIFRKIFQMMKKNEDFNKKFKEPKIELELIGKFVSDFN